MGDTTEKKEKASLKKIFKNLKIEFKKIIWPTKDELIKQTAVTLVVSLILGAIIFGLDKLIVYVLFHIIGL